MSNDEATFLNVFANWLPFVLYISITIYAVRQYNARARERLIESKRHNHQIEQLIERLAAADKSSP